MVNINLLPKFQIIPVKWLLFIVISLVLITFVHAQCAVTLSEKKDKIILLKKEIKAIDAEISNAPQKNIAFESPNTKNSAQLFIFLKKLPHTIPIGLYLIELSVAKHRLKLVGFAEKADLISSWLTTLRKLHFDGSLQEMTSSKEMNDFVVKFSVWVNF